MISNIAGEQEHFAAEELLSCFKKMTGAQLPIHKDLSNLDKPSIMILEGRRPANKGYLEKTQLEKLENDGYLIES